MWEQQLSVIEQLALEELGYIPGSSHDRAQANSLSVPMTKSDFEEWRARRVKSPDCNDSEAAPEAIQPSSNVRPQDMVSTGDLDQDWDILIASYESEDMTNLNQTSNQVHHKSPLEVVDSKTAKKIGVSISVGMESCDPSLDQDAVRARRTPMDVSSMIQFESRYRE